MSYSVCRKLRFHLCEASGERVATSALLTAEACRRVIALTDAARWDGGGDYAYATRDVEVDACEPLRAFLLSVGFVGRIAARIEWAHGRTIAAFDDLFVVRYDSAEQRELPKHVDGGDVSFMVALSDASEYDGGGTRFERLGSTLHLASLHRVL